MKTKFSVGALAVLVVVLLSSGMTFAAVTSFTIDPTEQLSPDRTVATATGSVQCTAGDTWGGLFVQIFQVDGRVLQMGTGFASLPRICSGGVDAWTVAVTDLITQWQPGPAAATAQFFDFTDQTNSGQVGARLSLQP